MTKRERKYHFHNRLCRMARQIHAEMGLPFDKDTTQDLYHFWTPTGIVKAPSTGEPVTITISKYNLPNTTSLQKGQLN